MDVHQFFLIFFLILITARILGELFNRLGIPSVLGEISAGLLLGASGLGFVTPNEVLKVMAEIGIILLLFEVGMESDLSELKKHGKQSLIVAFFGAVAPFIVGAGSAYYLFDIELASALFVGGTLTATSIGITLRVLKDLHMEKGEIAQIVLGAAVIDDIIGVLLLVFIYEIAISGVVSFTNTIHTGSTVLLFLIISPIFAYLLAPFIEKWSLKSKIPGFIPTVIISLILLFSYLSHSFGAPEIIGAFVAGVALSRSFILPFAVHFKTNKDFSKKLKQELSPIISLFTPIFFVMVGLSLDIHLIDFTSAKLWQMSAVFLFVAVIGKYLGAFLISAKCHVNQSLIGISMIPRGEVGLIFIEIGRVNEVLNHELYATLLFVIIITTLVPPFLLKWLFKYECKVEKGR